MNSMMEKNRKEALFIDEAECYIVFGCKTRKEAAEELHKYERECGLAEDELFDECGLKPARVTVFETEDGERNFKWSFKEVDVKHGKGPLAYIGYV